MLRKRILLLKETAGSPGEGLPVLTISTADGNYSQPSATAEMNNTRICAYRPEIVTQDFICFEGALV